MRQIGATIKDCVINGTADDAIGAFSDDPSNFRASGWLIEGNTINNGHSRGIVLYSLENGVLRNNTFKINPDSSIKFDVYDVADGNPNAENNNWEISHNRFITPWSGTVMRMVLPKAPIAVGRHDAINFEYNIIDGAPKANEFAGADAVG